MERSGLYNIYSSHWDTSEMCKPSVPGVLQRRQLEVTTYMYNLCDLCVTLLEISFMIDLAWFMIHAWPKYLCFVVPRIVNCA